MSQKTIVFWGAGPAKALPFGGLSTKESWP